MVEYCKDAIIFELMQYIIAVNQGPAQQLYNGIMCKWMAQAVDMTDKQSVRNALERMGIDSYYVLLERDSSRAIHFYPGLKQAFRKLLGDFS